MSPKFFLNVFSPLVAYIRNNWFSNGTTHLFVPFTLKSVGWVSLLSSTNCFNAEFGACVSLRRRRISRAARPRTLTGVGRFPSACNRLMLRLRDSYRAARDQPYLRGSSPRAIAPLVRLARVMHLSEGYAICPKVLRQAHIVQLALRLFSPASRLGSVRNSTPQTQRSPSRLDCRLLGNR